MREFFTTESVVPELEKHLNAQGIVLRSPVMAWRIQRLFELGILPEPDRLGQRRIIEKAMIPLIIHALRERGWLNEIPSEVTAEAAVA